MTFNNESNEKQDRKGVNKVTLDDGRKVPFDDAVNMVQNGYIDVKNQGSGKFEREYLKDEEKDYE